MTPEDVARLHAEHGRGLWLFARTVTRDDHLAEDALQTTFLALFERPMPPTRAYLYASVRNAALNLLRSRGRAERRERRSGRTELFEDSGAASVADREAVEAALAGLPEEQREVVVLKVWSGMTFAEIGEAIGAPSNTAASRYRYALEKLRRSLSEVPPA